MHHFPIALLLALSGSGAPDVDDDGPWIELPDGAVAKAWAGVGQNTRPAELELVLGEDEWLHLETWQTWAAALSQETQSATPDPRRRARLARLAAAQGRLDDAWRHFARLGPAPEWAAAVMPHLIPGVPRGTTIGPGGVPGPLPTDALLRPLVPPLPEIVAGEPQARVPWRHASVRGLRIGESLVDLEIEVESSGIEVKVHHRSGPPARFRLLLPEIEGYAIRSLYADWTRVGTENAIVEVVTRPDGEEYSVYGRVREQRVQLPAAPEGALPAQLVEGGITLVVTEDAADLARMNGIARVLTELLSIDVRVGKTGDSGANWTRTLVRLGAPGPEREALLQSLVGSIEAFLLGERF